MSAQKKMSLTNQIFIAMIAGIVLGSVLNAWSETAFIQNVFINGIFKVVGAVFIAFLKMLVVPLVFVSLTAGIAGFGDVSALGRIGIKTIALYLFTTMTAITIALTMATITSPGGKHESTSAFTPPAEAGNVADMIINMVPTNPIAAMANAEMLQIIIFALFFGVAISIAGDRGKHVLNFFNDLNEVVMKMVTLVMKLAPIGVFCLIAKTFASTGFSAISELIVYFMTVILALLVHSMVTFPLLLRLLGGLNPVTFYKKMRAVAIFGFSTSSSGATLPITLDTVENRMGAKKSIASFTVPLGTTINMDGTAIMQGVATVFIANVYGIDLSLMDFLTVILTATLASIGTAAIPSVGLVLLAMVLSQVGIPVEGISLIIGIDRLLDMLRTVVNISGDATVTCLVAKSENALDEDVFNDPQAGIITPADIHLPGKH